MRSSTQRSIRFEQALYRRVEAYAASQNRSIADVVRAALEDYLAGRKVLQDSDLRLRRVCEYAQLALDHVIKEDHPEVRDMILAETSARMERYHGTR
ncbi:hypothetical protein [Sphingomonas xinjiangensis]|uniref:Metal-responsive CopG/Arc/MetJ family transcriptional regulator n=1 Tax=Sphingomonas xinjiangensis TaxID=643568 RepID=A0A840YU84_9SPHN|nr:hypothetical protein [Sphingomonas xinjiangensis]MBB5713173.1 metal-responsive CopG/Arc/MetJ family transcriptional regulator [Sphingomonas xinjiangensis]